MVSLSPPIRPNGIPQMHTTRLIRLGPKAEPFTVVIGRDGLPVSIATLFLATARRLAASRQNKMASVVATILDLLVARSVDPDALMLTGDALTQNQVEDIIDAVHYVGCRTVSIRGSSELRVGNAEHTNRIDIAKKFISFWLSMRLHELRRNAYLHTHMRDLIEVIEGQFDTGKVPATSEPRHGLEPAELKFFDEVIHPSHQANPWGEDRFEIFCICVLYRLLGHRAREPLLFQMSDLVKREGQPALRLLPTDTLADRTGATIGLKRGPRHIRIPDWCATLLETWISVERPKIGERLAANGNLQAFKAFQNCPYMFVSSRGSRLSSTTLYNRLLQLRAAFPDQLPRDLSPARLRNSRADELVAASKENGFDLSRVAEAIFGWVPNSTMLQHYANMQAERDAGNHLRLRANMAEGITT